MRKRSIRIIAGFLFCLGTIPCVLASPSSSANQMTEAAIAFVATLDDSLRDSALFSLDSDERPTWSNLPIVMVEPRGLLIGDMNDEQRKATHALLRASMSSQGYAKVAGVMWLDDVLRDIEQPSVDKESETAKDPFHRAIADSRGSGNYAVAIYGDPGDGDWGWKLAGHHLAVNFTVSKNRVGFTPIFLGSNPMAIESGRYAGRMVLSHEGQRGVDLMQSLSKAQQQKALIDPDVARDVFEGPGRRASLTKFEGLAADELTDHQMQLLRLLVREYLENVDYDAAAAQLELIEQGGWGELWISWRGSADIAEQFYYRVHGPRLLIEYARQDENHDHSIMRDPANDYGEDWLEQHYKENHPTLEQAIQDTRRRAAEQYNQ
jgi:hypothetical protein